MRLSEQWEALRMQFLAQIEEIDVATPWSEAGPQWWLEMAEFRRFIHNQRNKPQSNPRP